MVTFFIYIHLICDVYLLTFFVKIWMVQEKKNLVNQVHELYLFKDLNKCTHIGPLVVVFP